MEVSIVIVNYHTTALTLACVTSIYQYTLKNSFELILVDNASSDQSLTAALQQFPDVRIIYNTENQGFGKANNQGIEMAKGKYVFLLNSDTELTNDAIALFFDFMENSANHDVACCGADLIFKDGSPQVPYGNFPSFAEAVSALGFLVFYKQYFSRHLSSGVYNYSTVNIDVDYICGADMFIRKSVLKETGLFDPDFFLYFEEVELSLRMKQLKYRSVLLPYVKIIHHGGGSDDSGSSYNLKKMMLFAKSRKIYFKKRYGSMAAIIINKIYGLQGFIFFFTKCKKIYLKIGWKLLINGV